MKLRAGNFRYQTKIEKVKNRLYLRFPYAPKLIQEIKAMDGARWHPDAKCWSILDNSRNHFQLAYLKEENPYAQYDKPINPVTPSRAILKQNQIQMIQHGLTYRQMIWAAEMGLGKSLAAIEVMELSGYASHECWYVGPKSGVTAVRRELRKWDSKISPYMITYEGLVKELKNWRDGRPSPKLVIFDESSKVKTPTAQRAQSAAHLANNMRAEHHEPIIIEMTGTPAPKSPVDWWMQAEIACPGFIKEGNIKKFKYRLCLIEMQESSQGAAYPKVITWLDNELKCATCGELKAKHGYEHVFKKSVNELDLLYKRMKGLVLVQFKKDWLDLPAKIYEIRKVRPSIEIMRAAKLITTQAPRAIQALTLLRELSDGFQYIETKSGTSECENCSGTGHVIINVPITEYDVNDPTPSTDELEYQEEDTICQLCKGSGETPTYVRGEKEIGTPKDAELVQVLEEHEEVGRIIIWAGFTASIDRIRRICLENKWAVLQVDGRGYQSFNNNGVDLLDEMDSSSNTKTIDKLAFVGHPEAGGMALTLTASPTEVFYSNCFSGQARMQAEDRFHRHGMVGSRIIDFICLKTDQLVLDNLQQKKDLQSLTLGQVKEALEEEEHGTK